MNPSTPATRRKLPCAVALLLFLATLGLYSQVLSFDFVNFDDNLYVTDNAQVQRGLSLEGLRWALTTGDTANWYPLTWLSHMLDVEVFGMGSAGHHAISVLLHAVSTVLLFYVLLRMTGAVGPSALVAGLFALHPLRVESVAWVAERKDVLSTVFWMLTLLAYVRYTELRTRGRYGTVAGCLALGLMAKPMLVTLPLVLLLLDYWPLGRFEGAQGRLMQRAGRLVLEKAPLLAMAAAVSVVTFVLQSGEAMATLETAPMAGRVLGALAAYGIYIRQTFWPVGLAVFYPPPPQSVLVPQAILGAGLLAAGTAAVVLWARRRPYFAVGWLWYLGTLVPVIGLVQVGAQAHADRYTYVPEIGLWIVLVWGVRGLVAQRPNNTRAAAAVSALALAAYAAVAWVQIGHWRNSRTLFQHALEVTEDNGRAHDYLGQALVEEGRIDDAIAHFLEAVRLEPYNPQPVFNLGLAYHRQGRTREARNQFEQALRLNQAHVRSHFMLGNLDLDAGDLAGARAHYSAAIEADPETVDARINLAIVLARIGRPDEAERHFRRVLDGHPAKAEALYNYALLCVKQSRTVQARDLLERVLQARPEHVEAHRQLGRILLELGRPDEAELHFNMAAELEAEERAGARRHFDKAREIRQRDLDP